MKPSGKLTVHVKRCKMEQDEDAYYYSSYLLSTDSTTTRNIHFAGVPICEMRQDSWQDTLWTMPSVFFPPPKQMAVCIVYCETSSRVFDQMIEVDPSCFFFNFAKMDIREYRLCEHQHFSELIDSKTVRCKCGARIRLDRPYAPKNLKKHAASSACLYSQDGQTNLGMFFGNDRLKDSEQDVDETPTNKRPALVCQGLTGDEYLNYIAKTPTRFGGGKRTEVIGHELFSEKFPHPKPFSRKKLSKTERETFDKAVHAASQWEVFKEFNCIKSTNCGNYTQNENQVCDECMALKNNKRFNEALKAVSTKIKCFTLMN